MKNLIKFLVNWFLLILAYSILFVILFCTISLVFGLFYGGIFSSDVSKVVDNTIFWILDSIIFGSVLYGMWRSYAYDKMLAKKKRIMQMTEDSKINEFNFN